MFNDEQEKLITQTTRTIQIIALSLIMGVVLFGTVILTVGMGEVEPPENPIIWIIACAFAVFTIPAWIVVPNLIGNGLRRNVIDGKPLNVNQPRYDPQAVGDVGPILGVFITKQVVGRALLEGAAFFNLIAYIIEGQSVSLMVAGALVLAMSFNFPIRNHVEQFVRDELATIEQMRDLAPNSE